MWVTLASRLIVLRSRQFSIRFPRILLVDKHARIEIHENLIQILARKARISFTSNMPSLTVLLVSALRHYARILLDAGSRR